MTKRLVVAGIIGPAAIVLAGFALGWVGDADSAPPAVDRTTDAGRNHLPCTLENEVTNFTAYSLGEAFEGLRVTHQSRVCTRPNPQSVAPDARINIVEYIYGRCPILDEVSRCRPPLAVQTWPRCEREPADYAVDHHNPLVRKLSVRGVPAHLYEAGLRLEVYAGDSTVVVFGIDPDQVLRAARALVKAPAKPNAPLGRTADTSVDLPQPPPRPIRCD